MSSKKTMKTSVTGKVGCQYPTGDLPVSNAYKMPSQRILAPLLGGGVGVFKADLGSVCSVQVIDYSGHLVKDLPLAGRIFPLYRRGQITGYTFVRN
ncbi:MAG: hypothetical protein JW716_01305 [Candidatus Aenigmarchaeota archaeon]|nr:hypothetical protein [Candidatus Aenigmarchaeota archaeon]